VLLAVSKGLKPVAASLSDKCLQTQLTLLQAARCKGIGRDRAWKITERQILTESSAILPVISYNTSLLTASRI